MIESWNLHTTADTEHSGFSSMPMPGKVRRAAFDKVAVAGIKKLVYAATLPENEEFAPGLRAFFATSGRPENRPFRQLLFENGFQQPDAIEIDLGTAIGKLRQNR